MSDSRARSRDGLLAKIAAGAVLMSVLAALGGRAAAEPTSPAGREPSRPSPPAADSSMTLDRLLGELRHSPGISADFTETKRIALLRAPLVNAGSVYFSPPATLARRVDSPRRSVVLVNGEQLTFADSGGIHRLDAGTSAVAGTLVSSFVSVLSGDRQSLQKRFEITFDTRGGERWRLFLRPREDQVRRVLASLEFEGKGIVVSEMTLREGNGDVTVSTFERVVPNRRFTAEEQARFFTVPASFR